VEKSPVKISIVSYTNTLPFKWALKNSRLLQEIDLQEDMPSICAQKLKFGQVDLALVPVALLPELPHYFIESDYCIGASGKVDSVKLYGDVPLEKMAGITLDYQSKSSITLTKVLAKNFWKINPNFMDASPGFEKNIHGSNGAVVIGDRTFNLNGKFKFEYDLAEEWEKFTGLPFVFAAWVSTEKMNNKFLQQFNKTLEYGVTHLEQAIKEQGPYAVLNETQVLDYLKNKIDYKLDDKKREALQLFLKYISDL